MTELSDKVDELLAVLDEDERRMELVLSRLDELRSLVIRRDEKGLGELLGNIAGEASRFSAVEARRYTLRKDLAGILGCGFEQATLSRLEQVVPEPQRAELAACKARLRTLAEQVRREYLKTKMLLSDCARFNGALLRGLLGLSAEGAVTYGCDGTAKRQDRTAFVSMQF